MGLGLPTLGEVAAVLEEEEEEEEDGNEDEGTKPPEAPLSAPTPTPFVLPLLPAVIILDEADEAEGKGWDVGVAIPEDCMRTNWKFVEDVERACPLVPVVAAEEEEEDDDDEEEAVGRRWLLPLPTLLVDDRLDWRTDGLEGRLVARRREKELPMPSPMPSPSPLAEVEEGKGAFSMASALNWAYASASKPKLSINNST